MQSAASIGKAAALALEQLISGAIGDGGGEGSGGGDGGGNNGGGGDGGGDEGSGGDGGGGLGGKTL